MRLMPPSSTAPTATVMMRPGTHRGTSRPNTVRDASTNVRATVFDWAMLPVPKSAVHVPKNANAPARKRPSGFDGTPRWM